MGFTFLLFLIVSTMSLPPSLKPRKDLMSKRTVQEPRVVNYIIEALANNT